jgi:hypothetical protein
LGEVSAIIMIWPVNSNGLPAGVGATLAKRTERKDSISNI